MNGAGSADELQWLFSLQLFGVKPGLERVGLLLEALGDPQRKFRVVLVGGTNGKGSTASVLATILAEAGFTAGLFTSPHLTRVMERFQVDGQELPLQQFTKVLRKVRPHAVALGATFFEILVAAACQLFADSQVELAVLEVGLGGRFDATNALSPELSVITNVALDHQAVLGNTVGQIARDKAGIFRAGVPALTGATGSALAVLEAAAAETGTPLRRLDHEYRYSAEPLGWAGSQVTLQWPAGKVSATSGLPGVHQQRNVALAMAAAVELGVPANAISSGVTAASWPGRLERLPWRDRWVVLDGAHNPAAALVLAEALAGLDVQPRVLLLGVNADKDVDGVIAELAGVAETVIATSASLSGRALPAAELALLLGQQPATVPAVAEPAAQALQLALQLTKPGDTILVAGSLYLIGEVRPLLTGEEPEQFERWQ
jgi:dihydrofolate synthase/folylpolyglutamate synthase